MVFGIGGSSDNEMEVVVTADGSQLDRELEAATRTITTFEGAIAGLGVAMSALATGAMVKAVGAAREWNSAVRELAKVTDPTTAKELGDEMVELSRAIPLASEELMEIATAAARFGIASDEVSAFTDAVAKMAFATELSVEEAGQAFARLSTLARVPVDDIDNLGSVINLLGQTTASSTRDIVNAMLRSSASLAQIGMQAPDIAALNAVLAGLSPNAETAGRGLRRLAMNMLDPTKIANVAGALGMTVDQFKNMRDEDPTGLILHMAEVMAENGEEAETLTGVLDTFSLQTLLNLSNGLDDARGALERSATEMEENTSLAREFDLEMEALGSELQLLRNAISEVAASIGGVLIPYIKQAIQAITPMVQGLADWVAAGNEAKAAAVLLGTAIGGLIPAFILASRAIGPLVPILKGLAGGFAALTGPIGLAIGAVVGFAAAYQTNFATVRDETDRVIGKFVEEFQPVWDALGVLVQTVTSDIALAFGGMGGDIEAIIAALVGAIGDGLVVAIERLAEVTLTTVTNLTQWWTAHRDTVVPMMEGIATAITETLEAAILALEIAGAAALLGLQSAWVLYDEVVNPILTGQVTDIEDLQVAMVEAFDRMRTTLDEYGIVFGEVFAQVGVDLDEYAAGLTETGQLQSDELGYWDQLWVEHGQRVVTSLDELRIAITEAFTLITEAVVTILQPFFERAEEFWATHGEQIETILTNAAEIWGLIFETFLAGVADKFVAWTDKWTERITLFTTVAETLWTDHGAKLGTIVELALDVIFGFFEFYLDLIQTTQETFLLAVEGKWGEVLDRIAVFVGDTFEGILSFMTEWGTRFVEWAGGMLEDAYQKFVDWANDLFYGSLIPDLFGDILDAAGAFGETLLGIITDLLDATFTEWADKATAIYERTVKWFDDTVTAATNFATAALGVIATFLADVLTDVDNWGLASAMEGVFNDAKTKIDGALGRIESAVSSALGRIETMAGDMVAAATSAWERAKEIAGRTVGGNSGSSGRKRRRRKSRGSGRTGSATPTESQKKAFSGADESTSGGSTVGGITESQKRALQGGGMAAGGLVTSPITTLIGEGGEPEAVIPLSRFFDDLVPMIQSTAPGGANSPGSGRTINVTVNADSYEGGRAAARGFTSALRSHNFD